MGFRFWTRFVMDAGCPGCGRMSGLAGRAGCPGPVAAGSSSFSSSMLGLGPLILLGHLGCT